MRWEPWRAGEQKTNMTSWVFTGTPSELVRMGVRSGHSGQSMKAAATGSADSLHVVVRGRKNLRFLYEPHKGGAASRMAAGGAGTT